MPLIYRMHCEVCGESELIGPLQAVYVQLADGSRQILGHPGEDTRARQLTGQDFATLRAEGRVGHLRLAGCRTCGELMWLDAFDDPVACFRCQEANIIRDLHVELIDGGGTLPCSNCPDGTRKLDAVGMS